MFRQMRRVRQQLPQAECEEILRTALRGVLCVNGDDRYPYGAPMNHLFDAEEGAIYFHSGPTGHRLDAIKQDDKCSFCVTDEGKREDGNWFLTFRSVVVFGRLEEVSDPERIEAVCRRLSAKFTSDQAYVDREIRDSLSHTRCLRLSVEHMTGKRVQER